MWNELLHEMFLDNIQDLCIYMFFLLYFTELENQSFHFQLWYSRIILAIVTKLKILYYLINCDVFPVTLTDFCEIISCFYLKHIKIQSWL